MLVAIDIGTTNLKVGLYREDGTMETSSTSPMTQFFHKDGFTYYDPDLLWTTVYTQIQEVVQNRGEAPVHGIGITSMAESGLLVNLDTGKPNSEIIPWFDSSSIDQADRIARNIDPVEHFRKTGLHMSFKYGIAKLLWLKDRDTSLVEGNVVWISVSSFIAYKLTGKIAEERTLAARSFAYQLDENKWDEPFIHNFGLQSKIFPNVVHCLEPVGSVTKEVANLGLNKQANVYIAGHDHVCSSLAAGIKVPGQVYNSMGTAETLVGTFEKRKLNKKDFESKLSFGLHHVENLLFWMGGHSSSGGSVEWIRQIIGDTQLSYAEVNDLVERAPQEPTGIIYYPYLTGSGVPYPNPNVKAAFVGLHKNHGKAELLKAVLEGNAFQMELIKEAAEMTTDLSINEMIVIGGGVRNPHWIQVKSNVSGAELILPNLSEAAMQGAALVAATGEGIYASLEDAVEKTQVDSLQKVSPDRVQHQTYRNLYENKFKPLRNIVENG